MSALRLIVRLLTGLFLGVTARALAEPELHGRGGLPHVAARAAAGGELRVAYLGGSITAAEGWRPLATAHLRQLFPQLAIAEIPAGLPGTGSDLGACRVGRDVLVRRPDLLFVEFAVNDAAAPPEQIERTLEGIVRQVWQANPRTDVCFVYTVSTPGLPELAAGRFPAAAQAMERVAEHYGIPSVHFGVEVARRVEAGSLVFKDPAAPDDPRTFSSDGVHPTPAGHRLYSSVLERSLPALLTEVKARPAALPPPLRPDNWSGASQRDIDPSLRRGPWTAVSPDDPNLRGVTKALLPPTWRATEPGAAIEFEFTGHQLGLLGIAAPDSGKFRVTVNGQTPVDGTFFDAYASPTFCRQRTWFYPATLSPGPHRVKVELLGTTIDKLAIKAAAGKPADDPRPYAAHTLTLCGLLTIAASAP